ncbi:MAG: hypothetical protein A3G81_17675 [Betaproteobacteria bacterium RIFCSPLOWO2_12_FULL_65_14]|nr:MAG: hypothetical protein A3G81_17675 [Betaproteobacteria bacterium RIFCSPLOWO2_12_FULL_65_14]
MTGGTIGITFDGFNSFPESLEIARKAVSAGVKSLWMAEHLGYREAIASCMAFAISFPGVKIVPTAISPYIRHPTTTAAAMATLDEASPGNIALAVGTGNPMFLGESGLSIEKPIRAISEYTAMLRALWTGEAVQKEGMLHRLNGVRLAFKPSRPIPIYFCPMKEQMLRLSGKLADGLVLSGGLSADFVAHSLEFAKAGAMEAGRDFKNIWKAAYVYFLATRSPKAGHETLRMKLAFLMRNRYIDDNIAHSGLPIDQRGIMDAISRRDFAAAGRMVPDEAVDAFAITGTAAQCRAGVERFLSAGIDELVLIMAGEAGDREIGFEVIRDLVG